MAGGGLPHAALGGHQEKEKRLLSVKKTICKYWEMGTCRNGDQCTWAHGQEEVGAPMPEEALLLAAAAGASGDGGPFLNFCGDLSSLLPENLANLGVPGLEGLNATSPEYQQALEELLTAESADLLLAQELGLTGAAQGAAAQGAAIAQDTGVMRRSICKFWQEGTCAKQDGQCGFAHGEAELGTRGPSQQRILVPCRFFAQGSCQKGPLCPFSHELPGEEPEAKRRRFGEGPTWLRQT